MCLNARFATVAGALACLAASGHAVVIDYFSEGMDSLTISNANAYVSASESGKTIMGGQRDTLLYSMSDPLNLPMTLSIATSHTGAFFASAPQATGYVQFDYSGQHTESNTTFQGPGSGLNVNLSADGAFLLGVQSSNGPLRVDITAETYLMGPAIAQSVNGTLTIPGRVTSPTEFGLSFPSMSTGTTVPAKFDFGRVDRVVIRVTPLSLGGSFALSSLSAEPLPSRKR